jgi:hypothetical protein
MGESPSSGTAVDSMEKQNSNAVPTAIKWDLANRP